MDINIKNDNDSIVHNIIIDSDRVGHENRSIDVEIILNAVGNLSR